MTVVVPEGKLDPGACVVVNTAGPQLSEAVGTGQPTVLEQPLDKLTEMFDGQFENVGGFVSTLPGKQHMGPPVRLAAPSTVKLPRVVPTSIPDEQVVDVVKLRPRLTYTSSTLPSNLSFIVEPVTVKTSPGKTRSAEYRVPPLSFADTLTASGPLYSSVRLTKSPAQVEQACIGGQLHPCPSAIRELQNSSKRKIIRITGLKTTEIFIS